MILRPIERADLPLTVAWRNDPHARPGLRTPFPLNQDQQDAFYREVICNRASLHRYWILEVEPSAGAECIHCGCPDNGRHYGPPAWSASGCSHHEDCPGFGASRAVGMGGLTNIQWENRIAEISLITDPSVRGKGYGAEGTRLLLREAFLSFGLLTVCGEVYRVNPATQFWEKMIARYSGEQVTLPRRKWWHGRLHDAIYFTFTAERTLPLVTEDEAA